MKKRIKNSLFQLTSSLEEYISRNKQKILGAAATVPLIAASTISGACAGGCPFGLVNDPYPGQCSRYLDLNGDGICDLSQSASSTATSPTSTGQTSSQSTSQSSSHSTSSQNSAYDSNTGVQDNGNNDPSNASAIQDQGNGGLDNGTLPVDTHNYHILPLTFLLIGGYFFTCYLFQKGILKPQQHKRIWNLLLVGGYAGTGITGVLLTFMVNLGISSIYNPGITYWHAELAILMVVGTLIHLHIYRKPFLKMFKVLFIFGKDSGRKSGLKSVNLSK